MASETQETILALTTILFPLNIQVVISQIYPTKTVPDPAKEDVIITIFTWHKSPL